MSGSLPLRSLRCIQNLILSNDSFGLLLNGVASETYGGAGGNAYRYMCPAGTFVVGIHGRSGARIDSLGVICGDLNHTQYYSSQAYGGTGGDAFRFTCLKGFRVQKVQGLSDRVINRINVFCGM